MDHGRTSILAARIMNCLQTILELEPMLRRLESGKALLADFDTLRSFMDGMDDVQLEETDVARIEAATETFLQELRTPAALGRPGAAKDSAIQ